jgi:hypothetical protein
LILCLLQGDHNDADIVCEDIAHGVHVIKEGGGCVDNRFECDRLMLMAVYEDEDDIADVLP